MVVGEDDDDEGMQQDISELRMRPKRLPLFQIATEKVDDAKPAGNPFSGFFLFLETQKVKDPSSQKTHSQFEKLSLAKVILKQGSNYQLE